jgi:hypothetical protein
LDLLGWRLIRRGWDVALGNPRLKLRILSRAGKAAFAVIVNASVDLRVFWVTFRKHFENHNSALQARKAVVTPDALLKEHPRPTVKPDATRASMLIISVVALAKAGTTLQVVFVPEWDMA